MMDYASSRPITLHVNGLTYQGSAEPRVNLADFLRSDLKLTGTHVGCEHGVCGACTVLVDGYSTRSCLMLAVQAQGSDIRTVEGLATDGVLDILQACFHQHHALQCGFCTAGILMSATELLAMDPEPDESAVRDVLSGHICRCTGYQNIVSAILDAASQLRERATHAGSN